MKAFVSMLRFSVSAVVFSASMHAFAIECIPTPSKQCVDTITVTATTLGDVDFGGGGDLGGGGGVVAVAGGATPEKSFLENHIKKVALFCKKADQSCSDWGQSLSFSVCGKGAYVLLVSVCNIAINDQVDRNCPDVPSCPAG